MAQVLNRFLLLGLGNKDKHFCFTVELATAVL